MYPYPSTVCREMWKKGKSHHERKISSSFSAFVINIIKSERKKESFIVMIALLLQYNPYMNIIRLVGYGPGQCAVQYTVQCHCHHHHPSSTTQSLCGFIRIHEPARTYYVVTGERSKLKWEPLRNHPHHYILHHRHHHHHIIIF